jgi:peptidoglycan/LPS O-acetylase OafA/YrhL
MMKMIKEISSQRLEFLDGLRGIAALAVILFHFNGTLNDHGLTVMPMFINFLCEWGHYGVQIFFVLSGFVIAYSLRNEHISPHFCLRFFLKRSIRLDPPYWVIVGVMLTLNFLAHHLFQKEGDLLATPLQVIANLLYLPDFLQVSRILPVAWTLCIEIQFYLAFVFLLYLSQSLTKPFFSPFIFGLLMILSLLQNTSWSLVPSIPGLFIPYWYSFFMGCMVCWTMINMMSRSLLYAYFSILSCYALIQGSADAFATLMVALIIYLAAVLGGMHRWLTSWFFQYTGKISYSLYLIHWPFGMKFIDLSLRFFGHAIQSLWAVALLMLISLALTFVVAHCFYYLIELPSLNLSRRLKKGSLWNLKPSLEKSNPI